jgi:hypothetical protein
MTTHNPEAELANLIAAAERACDSKSRKTPASSWATSAIETEVGANSLMQKARIGAPGEIRTPDLLVRSSRPRQSWNLGNCM